MGHGFTRTDKLVCAQVQCLLRQSDSQSLAAGNRYIQNYSAKTQSIGSRRPVGIKVRLMGAGALSAAWIKGIGIALTRELKGHWAEADAASYKYVREGNNNAL